MVEAEEVVGRGVEIVDVDAIFGDRDAVVVGGAVDEAGLDAAACQPRGEDLVAMLPAKGRRA
jgi:hypothetical protein